MKLLLLISTSLWALLHFVATTTIRRCVPEFQNAIANHRYAKRHSVDREEISVRRFAVRVVSCFHAMFGFAAGLSIIAELTNGTMTSIPTNKNAAPSSTITTIVGIEAGFYLFDFLSDVYRFVRIEKEKKKTFLDVLFFLHHLVPIVVFPAYSMWRSNKLVVLSTTSIVSNNLPLLDYITAALLVTNVGTTLTNISWMRKVLTQNESSLLLQTLIVVVYCVCRILVWPWLLSMYRDQQRNDEHHGDDDLSLWHVLWMLPFRCSTGTVTLCLINIYFFALNVQKWMKMIRSRYDGGNHHSQIHIECEEEVKKKK